MLGCRSAFGVGCSALVMLFAFGCGGSTSHGPDDDDSNPSAGRPGAAGAGGRASGGSVGRAGSAGFASAGSRNIGGSGQEPDPIDTGCKPEDLPPPINECDPFGANTCGPGLGCFPFVEHPAGSGCDAQVYGARCTSTGFGTQGALCGEEVGDWCAAGHVCVVGQRAGKRCAALCKPGVSGQCSGGLICGDLDVSGYGVCG